MNWAGLGEAADLQSQVKSRHLKTKFQDNEIQDKYCAEPKSSSPTNVSAADEKQGYCLSTFINIMHIVRQHNFGGNV